MPQLPYPRPGETWHQQKSAEFRELSRRVDLLSRTPTGGQGQFKTHMPRDKTVAITRIPISTSAELTVREVVHAEVPPKAPDVGGDYIRWDGPEWTAYIAPGHTAEDYRDFYADPTVAPTTETTLLRAHMKDGSWQVEMPAVGDGGGGIVRTGLWTCSRDPNIVQIYEVDPIELCLIPSRQIIAPSISSYGIGGDLDTIWYIDSSLPKFWKLSGANMCQEAQGAHNAILDKRRDIGGTSTVCWVAGVEYDGARGDERIWRHDPTTLGSIDSFLAPYPGTDPAGIGGNENVIWYMNDTGFIKKLLPDGTPDGDGWVMPDYGLRTPRSIGGDENVVYVVTVDEGDRDKASKLYRLDPNEETFSQPGGGRQMVILKDRMFSEINLAGIGG